MDRKAQEAYFHNQREFDRNSLSKKEFLKKYPNSGFYSITATVEEFKDKLIQNISKNAVILDYCCGLGQASRKFAKFDAKKIYGIDISDKEIATAKAIAEQEGLTNVEYHVMDAERMSFPDVTFDIIVCNGVLHHLDVSIAYKELFRVLKPGGVIVAHESLGYNPFIQLYRRVTPNLRTSWETDHILTIKEVRQAEDYFKLDKVRYFYLASIAAIPFSGKKFFTPLLKMLEAIDSMLLRLPLIRLMAWQMVFVMKKE